MGADAFAENSALARDEADPSRRADFRVPPWPGAEGAEWAYFAGNSLGLQPRAAAAAMEQELEAWAELAVEGWFEGGEPWLTAADQLRPSIGRLVGADPEEVVAMNTLTVNLHLMMATFYRPTPERHRIVIEDAAFPSDSHAVASQVRHHGYDPASAVVRLRPREGEAALRTEDIVAALELQRGAVALVLLGGVNYLTGELFEIPEVTAAAHDIGAVVGWDLAHAVGNVPLELSAWDVDWAAWCHYKYVNAGPGAPGGAFVHRRHARDDSLPRLAGWWGNDPATRFRMEPGFVPRAGRRRLAGLDAARARVRAAARVAGAVRRRGHARPARALAPSHRLPGVAARSGRRRAPCADPDAPRRGAPRLPALALRPRRAHALAAPARGARRDLRRAGARRHPPRAGAAVLELPRLLARRDGAARPAAGQVTRAAPTSTLSYGPHREQVADLWLPAGPGPHPAVVLVHGGCWREQYRRDLEDRVAADLAARGLAVWNVEYRRLDCDGDWPAPLDDVVAAAMALPDEVDRERVALAGHSAGGHLALLAAGRVRVRGVLAQAPVSDLPLAAQLGACSGAVERLIAQGAPSPIDEPPAVETLLVHGDADEARLGRAQPPLCERRARGLRRAGRLRPHGAPRSRKRRRSAGRQLARAAARLSRASALRAAPSAP